MAAITVTVWATSSGVVECAVGEYNTGTYITASNPLQVLAGDTVTFKIGTYWSGSEIFTFSGFASTHWTNTANDTAYNWNLFYQDWFTKTIKSPPTSYSTDTISISTTGWSGSCYVQTITALDTDPDLAGVLGWNKYNASENFEELKSFNLSGITAGQTVTLVGSVSGGTGAFLTMSNTNMNGTYTSSITAQLGDLIWVKMNTGTQDDIQVTFTLTCNNSSVSRIVKSGNTYTSGYDTIDNVGPVSGTISASQFMHPLGCHPNYYGIASDKRNDLSNYYRGGSTLPDLAGNAAVPTSGAISFSQMYNLFSRYYVYDPIPDKYLNVTGVVNSTTYQQGFGINDFLAGYGQQHYCSEFRCRQPIPFSIGYYDSSLNLISSDVLYGLTGNPSVDLVWQSGNSQSYISMTTNTQSNWKYLYMTLLFTMEERNIIKTDASNAFPFTALFVSLER